MYIENGKEILCIRFVNVGGYDSMVEHQKLIEEEGFVWFGKIGNKPTKKALDNMLNNESCYILLKDPNNAYICEFLEYSLEMPENGYPSYYLTEILPKREFSIWFKLSSIKKVEDNSQLNNIILKSSRIPILETAKKSMASHFYTVTKVDLEL